MPYEQWEKEEKEDEEIDKQEEAEANKKEETEERCSYDQEERPQLPELKMTHLMAFSCLKKLTVVIECQFQPRLLGIRTQCTFPTLTSLALRMDRSVRVEDGSATSSLNSVTSKIGSILTSMSCPALKVLDFEGLQSWELGRQLSYFVLYPQRLGLALESISIRIRPNHFIDFLQELRNHLLNHAGALPLPNLKKLSLTLHGDWAQRYTLDSLSANNHPPFLDQCLAYPTACTRLFSLPFLQFTVTGNRREKQARDNVTSFWSKTDEEGLKRQQLALLFDAFGPGDSPFVPQAVVDLLSNPKRMLPTLAILDGLEILLRECPVVGLEGMVERIPILADVVMNTLHTAAAPTPAAGMEEPALTLGRIAALVSIRRPDWLRGKKSFSLLFATALVERGLIKKLLEILAQGKDKEGKETASSVMFLLRALPVEAFRPEGGEEEGEGGGKGGGVTIRLLLCLVDIVVSRHARQDIRRLWNLSVLVQLFKMCPFEEVVLPVVGARENVLSRAILSLVGVGYLKAWGTSSQGGRLVHPAVGMMELLVVMQGEGGRERGEGGASFVMRMRERVMRGEVVVGRGGTERRRLSKLEEEEEERGRIAREAFTAKGWKGKGKKRGKVQEEGRGAEASSVPQANTIAGGSSSSSSSSSSCLSKGQLMARLVIGCSYFDRSLAVLFPPPPAPPSGERSGGGKKKVGKKGGEEEGGGAKAGTSCTTSNSSSSSMEDVVAALLAAKKEEEEEGGTTNSTPAAGWAQQGAFTLSRMELGLAVRKMLLAGGEVKKLLVGRAGRSNLLPLLLALPEQEDDPSEVFELMCKLYEEEGEEEEGEEEQQEEEGKRRMKRRLERALEDMVLCARASSVYQEVVTRAVVQFLRNLPAKPPTLLKPLLELLFEGEEEEGKEREKEGGRKGKKKGKGKGGGGEGGKAGNLVMYEVVLGFAEESWGHVMKVYGIVQGLQRAMEQGGREGGVVVEPFLRRPLVMARVVRLAVKVCERLHGDYHGCMRQGLMRQLNRVFKLMSVEEREEVRREVVVPLREEFPGGAKTVEKNFKLVDDVQEGRKGGEEERWDVGEGSVSDSSESDGWDEGWGDDEEEEEEEEEDWDAAEGEEEGEEGEDGEGELLSAAAAAAAAEEAEAEAEELEMLEIMEEISESDQGEDEDEDEDDDEEGSQGSSSGSSSGGSSGGGGGGAAAAAAAAAAGAPAHAFGAALAAYDEDEDEDEEGEGGEDYFSSDVDSMDFDDEEDGDNSEDEYGEGQEERQMNWLFRSGRDRADVEGLMMDCEAPLEEAQLWV
jgi:hypothetical protein